MRGRWLRLLLFFGSYAPLFAMLALRWLPVRIRHARPAEFTLSAAFLALAIAGVAVVGILLQQAKRVADGRAIVPYEVRDVGSGAVAYLTSYILPWFATDSRDWPVWAGFILYMVTLAVVATRSRMFLMNPTLMLFRHRVFEAKVRVSHGPGRKHIAQHLIIARQRPRVGEPLTVVSFDEEFLVR